MVEYMIYTGMFLVSSVAFALTDHLYLAGFAMFGALSVASRGTNSGNDEDEEK